ncbi:MAG: hypothetical protein K0V04_10135 [Deltaproteobacteria bacterium]|nr:hypothetical protein [Deltaproteobacteria bacterium]
MKPPLVGLRSGLADNVEAGVEHCDDDTVADVAAAPVDGGQVWAWLALLVQSLCKGSSL